MKKIKLFFGSVLAFIMAFTLVMPTSVFAEGTDPVFFDKDAFLANYAELDPVLINENSTSLEDMNVVNLETFIPGGIDASKVVFEDVTASMAYPTDETGSILIEKDDTYFMGVLLFGEAAGNVAMKITYNEDDVTSYSMIVEFKVKEVNVSEIRFDESAVSLKKGETKDVWVEFLPENWNINPGEVTVRNSDTSVVKIELIDEEDLTGAFSWQGLVRITGLSEGTATITAEIAGGKTTSLIVTVKEDGSTVIVPAAAGLSAPATGDTTNLSFYMVLLLAGLAGLTGYKFLRKEN
ncbi:hypothetical protein M2475_002238 [Breznakia sp. PF5-3]|uniref:Ig-like domain-containing protein n=1 Tax=unclassified Breznakia TaxID=2623764 RepID=UPI002405BD35|nr:MULTISPECIES: Ig-like domain-containing protein [unclassified Breznakia]MDF9825851.1 hypothetical protein [Breznakia sp. PM6-1]MDF9836656.1 hypothetical protein [Breznakia sp. PF5-3]MDF9838151.1 hypothetical protein [Breznakia sp. PFB2-8]MDF9860137.1 hypothetical protein [Breznakia sp. PH5-24]